MALNALSFETADLGGIAYAHSLLAAIRTEGTEARALHGFPVGNRQQVPIIKETEFFDAKLSAQVLDTEQNVLSPHGSLVARLARMGTAPLLGARATGIPFSGSVVQPGDLSLTLPAGSSWNLPDAVQLARGYFGVFRRTLPVVLPERTAVMHWTSPLPLRAVRVPNIYCFADLAALRLPFASPLDKRWYLRLCRRLVQRADHLLAASEACRRDMMSLLAAPADRITVAYQAAPLPDAVASKPERVRRDEIAATFGLGWRAYYLCCGPIQPLSNVGRVIEAFLASRSPLPLVIVGRRGYKADLELRAIHEDHVRFMERRSNRIVSQRRVTVIERLPQALLTSLMAGARAVLSPSLYDCTGHTAIAAMRLGTPVVASTTGAMPEVVGGAALTVDPYDVRAIANAITAIDQDSDLCRQLEAEGSRQAARFGVAGFRASLRTAHRALGLAPGRD